MNDRRGAPGSTWVVAFLLAVPTCAVVGGVVGWAAFGASAAADAVTVGNDSLQPAVELAAGAGAVAWNTLVVLAGGLVGALSGLVVAPLGVWLGRRRTQNDENDEDRPRSPK